MIVAKLPPLQGGFFLSAACSNSRGPFPWRLVQLWFEAVPFISRRGEMARKVHDSYRRSADRTAPWSRVSIKAVLEAREG